jgi:hypothetical protein
VVNGATCRCLVLCPTAAVSRALKASAVSASVFALVRRRPWMADPQAQTQGPPASQRLSQVRARAAGAGCGRAIGR